MRVSKKFITLLSVVVFSSVLSAAGNQSSFKDFDVNSDGTISEKEFDARKTANMTKRAEEGRQLRNVGNSPLFADLDANKDGKLSTSEYAKGQQLQMKNQKQNKNQVKNKGKGQGKGKNSKN
jgi:Ca2+-binding EF-hand superfamily protein